MKGNYKFSYNSPRSFVNYEFKTSALKSNQQSRDDMCCKILNGLFDKIPWLLLEELAEQRLGEGGKCDVIFLAI